VCVRVWWCDAERLATQDAVVAFLFPLLLVRPSCVLRWIPKKHKPGVFFVLHPSPPLSYSTLFLHFHTF
jgi:hypothetical protein